MWGIYAVREPAGSLASREAAKQSPPGSLPRRRARCVSSNLSGEAVGLGDALVSTRLRRVFNDQHRRLVCVIVRIAITRNVLSALSGIVSPALQFGTAAVKVGGSAGVPSSSSSQK